MQAWEDFLTSLEKSMGPQVVEKWLRTFEIVDFDACNLYLAAKDSFQIAWFEEHIRKLAKKNFRNNNGHVIAIHFATKRTTRAKKTHIEEHPPLTFASDSLDSSLSFLNFLTDDEGKLVKQFFQELTPATFNPIFLLGPQGSGKTHLLTATAQELIRQGLRVFFVHAETFTEHVVSAIRSSQMQRFRQIYRNQDVLIIDDVHVLARRSATQEELFHTFNTLHGSGKQIILSSHIQPSRLEEIEPRLTSRFEWGILLTLPSLSKGHLPELLQNRANTHHFPLSEELVSYLIEQFSTSNKALLRALDALMLRHRTSGPLELEGAKILLKDLLKEEEKAQITPEKITTTTAAYFGITAADLLGRSQAKECALPRKLAMYLCRKDLSLSYQAIGRYFTRDHSTVMSSIKQIEKKLSYDEVETALEEIDQSLKSESATLSTRKKVF